jgi:hypothetical protein
MTLAWQLEPQYVNLGDSAELDAYIYDQNDVPVPQAFLASVQYTIEDPSGTQTTQAGVIVGDGHAYSQYLNTSALVGKYIVVAQFTFANGQVKSSTSNFEVVDPFHPPAPSAMVVIGDLVWREIEDVFDAEQEGPWLRDMTLNTFSKDKMPEFIAEALFDINLQNPPTSLDVNYFVDDTGNPQTTAPLLVLGTFLAVILHLVTSYTEQPLPLGGQVTYEDRRDYNARWLQVYEVEMQRYMRWVALFKRQFLGLGHSKGLVFSKAGRLYGAGMRTQSAGRGFY